MVFLNCKYLTCVFCQASKLKLWWHKEYHAVICGPLVTRAGSPLCPSSLWLCLLQGVSCCVLALSILSYLIHPFSSSPALLSLVTTAAEVSAACGRGHLSCLITRLWMGWAGALTNRSHGSGGCWGLLGSALGAPKPGCVCAALLGHSVCGHWRCVVFLKASLFFRIIFPLPLIPSFWSSDRNLRRARNGTVYTLRISTRNSPSPSCPRFGTLRLSAL